MLTVSLIVRRQGQTKNEEVTAFIEDLLPERTAGIMEERRFTALPVLAYDGRDYAALLEMPVQNVKLPVAAGWDKFGVNTVPCRFEGSPYDGSLIIGGVDRAGQFDFLEKTDVGQELTLTTLKGERFTYTVASVIHAKNSRTETLESGDADLTLFTKTGPFGETLIVRCKIK